MSVARGPAASGGWDVSPMASCSVSMARPPPAAAAAAGPLPLAAFL